MKAKITLFFAVHHIAVRKHSLVGRALARALRVAGKTEPVFVEDIAEMPMRLREVARDGDVLLTMGAGSIGAVSAKVVDLLSKKELQAQGE